MPFASFRDAAANSSWPAPQFEPHLSFVTNVRIQVCGIIHDVPRKSQCQFVLDTPDCNEDMQFFDYMNFLYCVLNAGKAVFGVKVMVLILFCGYIFMFLGTTADAFFCPALVIISNALGLSENLAGVTLIAFGNGSPDLFTSLANVEGDTDLMYSELLGASIFIIGIVSASIVMVRPFTVNALLIIRDIVFFLIATITIHMSFSDEIINYVEAGSFVLIYFLFLLCAVADHFYKLVMKRRAQRLLGPVEDVKPEVVEELVRPRLVQQFLDDMNPIDRNDWREGNCFDRFCAVISVPIKFVLKLTIPCTDEDLPMCGWSRLLNSIQVVLMPVLMLLLKQAHEMKAFGISIFILVVPPLAVLAFVIFFISKTYKKPWFHMFFVLYAFVGSICIISTLANELVNMLKTIGIVANLSSSFLGMSMLAWGNSVGDLISNIALARRGLPHMAFAACFGGPMFNTLLGIGLVMILKISKSGHGHEHVRQGSLGVNCTLFLAIVLSFTLLALLLTHWQARRSVATLMIVIYVLFILISTFGEFQLVHPYGTDHQNEGQHDD